MNGRDKFWHGEGWEDARTYFEPQLRESERRRRRLEDDLRLSRIALGLERQGQDSTSLKPIRDLKDLFGGSDT